MGYSDNRRATLVRMWRILVLLRCRPHTLRELADKLSVCPRTIRRDIAALQAVPLPITARFDGDTRKGIRASEPQLWAWGETPAWPRRERAPVVDICDQELAGARPLPPFPVGPLLPPGARV